MTKLQEVSEISEKLWYFKHFLFVLILCVFTFCQYGCKCPSTCRDQQKALDALELEL